MSKKKKRLWVATGELTRNILGSKCSQAEEARETALYSIMPQLIPEQWALGTCSVRAERLSSHLRWGAAKPTGASVQTLRRARLVPVLFQQG